MKVNILAKLSRLVFNHLSIVLLLSIAFLSIPQLVLSVTEQSIPLACRETVPAIYPELNFSTFLGGSEGEYGRSIAVTDDGNCYVTGQTISSDFPTQNAFNSTYSGDTDAIISKFATNGSLLWSSYFGGSDTDIGIDISVVDDGSSYITGLTKSNDLPTINAYNNTIGGNNDVFLAKFSSSGSLLWSTFLGGSELDEGHSIAVASDGSCYITGLTNSSDFPTQNAYDSTHNGGSYDVFVSKFSSNGTFLWSTYLGGAAVEWGFGIAVASDGSCYVTGFTASSDFPTLNAYDATPNGDWDVFVTKFDSTGSLLWSTFLGGALWDEALDIAVAGDGSCYITGFAGSSDFPLQNAFYNTFGGFGDAFITKFSSEGLLLWSTYRGGNVTDRGYAINVKDDGSCYVTGETCSSDFPTKNAFIYSLSGEYDSFVSRFNATGFLCWSSYLGGTESDYGYGLAVTDNGSCFVTGVTQSDDFPTKNAYDATLSGGSDIFVTKFVDTPIPATQSSNVNGFLAFIIIMPIITFLKIIKHHSNKERKKLLIF